MWNARLYFAAGESWSWCDEIDFQPSSRSIGNTEFWIQVFNFDAPFEENNRGMRLALLRYEPQESPIILCR